MYTSYMLYQAERVKTAKEQREADAQTGQLAAEFARLWRTPGRRRADGQRGFETSRVHDACCCPSAGQQAICG